jgi:hypothetical protein
MKMVTVIFAETLEERRDSNPNVDLMYGLRVLEENIWT